MTEAATTSETDLEEKTAAPLELFFDLVFVFAITQTVALVVEDLTAEGVFHGLLVLAMLWWGWSNWTWVTNLVDLDPRAVRVAVLASMVGVFIMAHAVPYAFEGRGMWVALGYVYVRLIATGLALHDSKGDADKTRAFLTYLPPSAAGPIAIVIGAAIGGDAQQWFWLAGFALEIVAAEVAGRADWRIDAAHFAERHGLIMIIALGESIIVVGSVVAGEEPSASLAVLLGVGLLGACTMFWAYFDRLQEQWEIALREADVHETGHIARDVYSILHFPMIVGIVFYAVALEEAFHHPDDPLEGVVTTIFIAALALYFLAMVAATYRCWRTLLYERLIGVAVIAVVVGLWRDGSARNVVLVSTLVLIATMTAEYLRFRARIRAVT